MGHLREKHSSVNKQPVGKGEGMCEGSPYQQLSLGSKDTASSLPHPEEPHCLQEEFS